MIRNKFLRWVLGLSFFVLGLIQNSCNPYEKYPETHFYIQAEIDPSSAQISANVQMVLVAGREYIDSICFSLNPGLEMHALTAQELKHYKFSNTDTGRLVLYIQDPVSPGEQLHISMSYSGRLGKKEILNLDSSRLWYPFNEDTKPCTYQAKIALPGSWQIIHADAGIGKHGKMLVQSLDPQNYIEINFVAK